MTDEEVGKLRKRWASLERSASTSLDNKLMAVTVRAREDIVTLLADNAALREIVREVADLSPNANDLCSCYYYDHSRNFAGQMEEWITMGRPHRPDCIYAYARALLGEQP